MSESTREGSKTKEKFSKELYAQLTSYEQFSYKMLSFLFKGVLWVFIPFVLLIFIIDGFNFSVLLFLALVVFVYVPIYKQYVNRLQVKAAGRLDREKVDRVKDDSLENVKSLGNTVSINESSARSKILESNESENDFVAKAISLNMGASSFLVTLCAIFITALFVWSDGWGSSITKFFLYLSIILLAFSIWFPYSNFVKRQVVIGPDQIKIGKRSIYVREIKHVVCEGNGNTIEFHLTHTKEATQIRIEDEYQLKTRNHLKKWCEKLNVPFIEKD